jgi:probable F420-dependent oxidoreductase
MKIGLQIPIDKVTASGEFQSGTAVREFAQAIEKCGADACHLSEHPAPSADWLHNDPSGHDCLDQLTALSFAAAVTTKLKVMTNVLCLPFRNPFITAKAAATVQVLSDSRLILGVGLGYQKEEFDALGVEHKERAFLMDEALETIRLAWKGGPVVKKGRHFNATGNEPRPVPNPAPPIWVGGGSDAAMARAAKYGDGWIPHFGVPTNDPVLKASSIVSMEHLAEKFSRLKDMRAKLGKSGPFDLAIGGPFRPQKPDRENADKFIEQTRQHAACGATMVWTKFPATSKAAFLEMVAWFGEEIIPAINSK